ncbi:hypothetical protein GTA08_BOTSDO02274 [Neofusicoccum parvum]|nr:hypothetical protein GTA08_BOTSDO02274 [Neofusicoccum parvum]
MINVPSVSSPHTVGYTFSVFRWSPLFQGFIGPQCPKNCGIDPSLIPPPLPFPSSPGELASPITSGTIYQQTFNYAFYPNTLVAVDGRVLDPRAGVLSGLLPGGQIAALLCDGLYIGSMVVPYPLAWAAAVEELGIRLPVVLGGAATYVAG